MADNYEAMARVLRSLGAAGADHPVERVILMRETGLSETDVMAACDSIERRGWLYRHGATVVALFPQFAQFAGKHAGQLVALDILRWIRGSGLRYFAIMALPRELTLDPDYFALAVQDLEEGGAIKYLKRRDGFDEFQVLPGFRVYEFNLGHPWTNVNVQQHVGDVVGRDKNINTGQGAIVTGSRSHVQMGSDAAPILRELVAALRAQTELSATALDLLEKAAAMGTSDREVGALLRGATEIEPSLVERLRGWFAPIAASVASTALTDGLKRLLGM